MRTIGFLICLVGLVGLGTVGLGMVALGIAGCSSTPGPVQPMVGPNAEGPLKIDPAIKSYLDVPGGQQNYSYNANGLLEYNTVVRNKGSQSMFLSVRADFYDESNRVVESQDLVDRFPIDPNMEKPLRVAANNRQAKRMVIQIRPAK